MSALKRIVQDQLSNTGGTCRAAWISAVKVMNSAKGMGNGSRTHLILIHKSRELRFKIEVIIYSFVIQNDSRVKHTVADAQQDKQSVKVITFDAGIWSWGYLVVGCFWHFDIQGTREDSIPAGAYVPLSKHCRNNRITATLTVFWQSIGCKANLGFVKGAM